MGIEYREFLGTCDCVSSDGEVETISSYREDRDGNVVVLHRSKNTLAAEWCDKTQAFFVDGQPKPYRPTEPLLLLAS